MEFLKKYQVLFLASILLVFSFAIQFSFDGLIGVDGFYHIGMADQLKTQGVFSTNGTFEYLQFTTLHDTFANQHFLYHVFLVPFTFFDLIFGAKIAAALFSALAYFSLYVLLRILKVRYAFWWTLLLPILSEGFLFRMTLPRAPAVSLAATLGLLAIFIASVRSNVWRVPLFIGSVLLVWLYGGFVLYCALAGILLFSSVVVYGKKEKVWWKRVLTSFVISFIGIALGVVLHPYFPNILEYLRLQLFETGSFAHVAVGGEWLPYSLSGLLVNVFAPLLLFIVSLLLIVLNFVSRVVDRFAGVELESVFLYWKNATDRERFNIVFSFLIAVFVFLLQLSSRRYVEYYVPFALLFVAIQFSVVLRHRSVLVQQRKVFPNALLRKIVTLFVIVWVLVVGVVNVQSVIADAKANTSKRNINAVREIAQKAQERVPEGEVIFNVAWDDFPALFLFDRVHYYAWGLDPTFLYMYNPELYEKGKDIWDLRKKGEIHTILTEDFNVSYVYVNYKDETLRAHLKDRVEFDVVFDNEVGTIFKVNSTP